MAISQTSLVVPSLVIALLQFSLAVIDEVRIKVRSITNFLSC